MEENNKISASPKDFFLHFGSIIALYVSAFSLLALLFQVISYAFPDYQIWDNPYTGAIRSAIASLIVVFPIYIFLSWILTKSYKASPEKLGLGIRKWLGYFTLFVAGLVIIIDLIFLVNSFLRGELLLSFLLKIIAVFVVSGLIFSYYICDLRSDIGSRKRKIYAYSSITLVILSIVFGFMIMGSPLTQRLQAFDNQKVSHLQDIQWKILNYWQNTGRLPENLEALKDPLVGHIVPIDPQSNEPYGYEIVSDLEFKLCANFNLGVAYSLADSKYGINEDWSHDIGEKCFDRKIDPERFTKTIY